MTRQPPSPLDPTVTDRIRGLVQPDWLHTTRTRRIAAALGTAALGAAAPSGISGVGRLTGERF